MRRFTQFIFISRTSPYEIYAEKNHGRLIIDSVDANKIDSRVEIVKLDGDDKLDRLLLHDHSDLDEDENLQRLGELLRRHGKIIKVTSPITAADVFDHFLTQVECYDPHPIADVLKDWVQLSGVMRKTSLTQFMRSFMSNPQCNNGRLT